MERERLGRFGRRGLWGAVFLSASVLTLACLAAWGLSYRWMSGAEVGRMTTVNQPGQNLWVQSNESIWFRWQSGVLSIGVVRMVPAQGMQVNRPSVLKPWSWTGGSRMSFDPLDLNVQTAPRRGGVFEFVLHGGQTAIPPASPLAMLRNHSVVIPAWIPTAVFATLAWYSRRRLLAAAGFGPGRCPSCGYDLRATPERCPECGRGAG